MTRILLAALAGTITYFLVGWLVFEGLLGQYMSANTMQIAGFKKSPEESSMALLVVSCAAYALLLALVMDKWANVHTFNEGAILGAVMGVLIAVMTDTYWFSTSHFYNGAAPLLADVAAAGVTVGVMGGVIGWVLGKLASN
ncbi:MAG: hypothetical protein IPN76_17110 [Saprospiraceae bacterium]|nr:hypothetical protein [Saprospiraceae bacterium]